MPKMLNHLNTWHFSVLYLNSIVCYTQVTRSRVNRQCIIKELQSIRAVTDEGNYALMASLELRAVFNLINVIIFVNSILSAV